jgi:RNA polymerase sigma factor (sigma-70 family)
MKGRTDGEEKPAIMSRIGPEQLGRVFDAHADALALYARQWSDGPEDVVQEAFLQLARQTHAPDRVLPWLYRVVRNGAIAASRSDRRRRKREARASDRESWFAPNMDRIDADEVAKLLAELAPESRSVVVARIWGELTFEEIADAEGCSLTTAHRRYRAGLEQLHERSERTWTRPDATQKTT